MVEVALRRRTEGTPEPIPVIDGAQRAAIPGPADPKGLVFPIRVAPFEERGAVSDEYLRAILELWTSDDPTF